MEIMSVTQEKDKSVIEAEINGHKVTLYFSQQPNCEISAQIKMALLGSAIPDLTS